MPPKHRIIIDTDPGIDDILAMLLALSSPASDLEVLLISVTFGNIDVQSCLRNVVALFHVLAQEIAFRRVHSLPLGYDGINHFKPLVAIGASQPLQDSVAENADYFHGPDGLAGVHVSHPEFSPEEGWKDAFEKPEGGSVISKTASQEAGTEAAEDPHAFTPSFEPAHKEMLRLLRENPEDSITIVAIGPATNCALAAAEDPEAFLRVKEVVSMGAAVDMVGNVTPVAEFNVFADAVAAARLYALTSPNPASSMPPPTAAGSGKLDLGPYPGVLGRRLKLTLLSLDITELHVLSRGLFREISKPVVQTGSPLAAWMTAFMSYMLDKMERLHTGNEGDGAALALHDPMCIWYILTQEHPGWKVNVQDIRVETQGQWTKGMTVGDKRSRKRRNSDGEAPHDRGNWLGARSGNRIGKVVRSPGVDGLGRFMLERILGVVGGKV